MKVINMISVLILLLITNYVFAQTSNDAKYFHMLQIRERTIYKKCITYPEDLKEIGNYRVVEREANGNPLKIRFDYTEGVYVTFSKNWKSLRTRWIDVFFKNGLPYGIYANDSGIKIPFPDNSGGWEYDLRDTISANKSEYFTVSQQKLIEQYYIADKTSTLNNSASYNAVLKKLSEYPREWAMKDNLGIVYNLQDNYKFKWVEPSNYHPEAGDIYVKTLESYYAGKIKQKFYRNITDHPVIIKGIKKSKMGAKYEYSDASVKLEANEIIEFFTPAKEFNDKEETDFSFVQFFGDIGHVSNLMAAKPIKPGVIEVDSYVNTTFIRVKKGDKISLRASGTVTLGIIAGKGSPDGIVGFTDYNQVGNFRHGALLGRVGNEEWFLVGSSKTFIANTSGILQLTINDGDAENNFGAFTVEYSINK